MTPLTKRQRELFSALLRSFLEEGFANFTIDAATKRYKCSKSTVYALGDTRDAIIKRILISFFNEAARITQQQLATHKNPHTALTAYFEAIATSLKSASPAFMRDLTEVKVAQEIYGRNTKAALESIIQLIEAGIASGDFHAPNPRFLAAMITDTMQNIQCGAYAEHISAHDAYLELGRIVIASVRKSS
ncbi:TetR/AcrR family transcriptional regulator [Corynebacterium felinum]|uniref:AcrR family transcriptional regulator n=1 Tax=Corynebacterium felinum TaxID=131318 RepID=A0ABU2BDI1_9CORY|nr:MULTISPECIES: TetR/AcrR family transcriptional regulator [Corynebacterium]MDF5820408.1 TetR/AcrR family transcriptional regulator [Corynebacterium felinum]MDO4760448.1 TetR/AcrR family transcriptional regulator [Corynebacterium sp.]MDR7355444.1 AcrR family transcriptional regulator [Corynebacterium felinum]WJY94795.1 hypothetical protein CFELI_05860 [Corynebacterium felinum]